MTITSLYKKYFQKSKVFLYPVLGIEKGSLAPIQTYIQWDGHYSINDHKLICTYYLRDDEEFTHFEKKRLLEHRMFYDFKQLTNDIGVYVFDFSMYPDDWNCFIKGRYSQMSKEFKKRILSYARNRNTEEIDSNTVYRDSYVNPHKYFQTYSDILGIPKEDLERIGELCDLLDLQEETLISNIKQITIKLENHEQ